MATITSNRAPFGATIANLIAKKVEDLRTEYQLRQRYLTTVNELSRLSKAELQDIGVSTSDIESIARESTYGTDRV